MSIKNYLTKFFKKEKMKKINEELYVGSQISEGDVQLLKEHGIKQLSAIGLIMKVKGKQTLMQLEMRQIIMAYLLNIFLLHH